MRSDHIYKIMAADEWDVAKASGVYEGSEHDRRDGFIHFSTAEQIVETAAKHFSGRADLVLLAVDPTEFGSELRWEPSRGGTLFPHLYAPLPAAAIVQSFELPLGPDGLHQFPS